jgi:hypothetical protein
MGQMKQTDRTVNTSGPSNMTPLAPVKPCAIQELVDEFVRDKWIAPENRDREVIAIYQGQLRAAHRDVAEMRGRRDRETYSASWVGRFADFHGF